MGWDGVCVMISGEPVTIQEVCFANYKTYKTMKPFWESDTAFTNKYKVPNKNNLIRAMKTVMGVWGAINDMKDHDEYNRQAIQQYVNLGVGWTSVPTEAMTNIADFIGFGVDKTLEYIDAFKDVAKKTDYQQYSLEQRHIMDSLNQDTTVAAWAAALQDVGDYGMVVLSNKGNKSGSVTQWHIDDMALYSMSVRQRLYVYRKQCKGMQMKTFFPKH